MGAHFAPPFAILMMHKLETEALSRLAIKPKLYKRYIDDIILGPYKRDDAEIPNILNTFNAINSSIQFTIDIPPVNQPLHFLDISIAIGVGKINYTWYSKTSHSENTLKQDSWLPSYVKSNFLTNSAKNVASKSSTEEHQLHAFEKLRYRFKKNGYKYADPHSPVSYTHLTLPTILLV